MLSKKSKTPHCLDDILPISKTWSSFQHKIHNDITECYIILTSDICTTNLERLSIFMCILSKAYNLDLSGFVFMTFFSKPWNAIETFSV